MQIILEIIGEMIVLFILSYPGAFIRWMLTGRKRPFHEVLYDDSFPNEVIGLMAIGICIALIAWILRK